jgi:hypothetical protein
MATTGTTPSTTNPLDHSATNCKCSEVYRSGRTTSPSACDAAFTSSCADLAKLQDCDKRTDGECDLPVSCECDCTGAPYLMFEHAPQDGVYLSGLPDLFQFDYGCGADPNYIGCGPIVVSMMAYTWAERGYNDLIYGHWAANPDQPTTKWKDLAESVRDDMHGICVGGVLVDPLSYLDPSKPDQDGEFAVTQDELERELNAYPTNMGEKQPTVGHYRVCGDCDVNDPGDLSKEDGLAKITSMLEYGNPIIIGFNTGDAMKTSQMVDGEKVYTGGLSVGVGFINHYALVTGYRHAHGMDIIYMNTGLLDTPADVAFEWNPAGKWTHLFTFALTGAVDDHDKFCPLDGDVTFAAGKDVQFSHAGKTTTSGSRSLTPLGGKSCGIVRDGKDVLVTPTSTTTTRCLTLTDKAKLDQSAAEIVPEIDDISPPAWATPL